MRRYLAAGMPGARQGLGNKRDAADARSQRMKVAQVSVGVQPARVLEVASKHGALLISNRILVHLDASVMRASFEFPTVALHGGISVSSRTTGAPNGSLPLKAWACSLPGKETLNGASHTGALLLTEVPSTVQ